MNNSGGRPSLGPNGESRVSVRIKERGGDGYNLSLLAIQREFLSSVGQGNRSAGFRRIIRFLSKTAQIQPVLENIIYQSIDPSLEAVRDRDLADWLKELGEILEHGRSVGEENPDGS